LDSECIDQLAHHVRLLELVARHGHEFDALHFHIDYLHYPLSRQLGYRHVTTLHGRLDIPDLADLYEDFCDMPVVSISDSQRDPLPLIGWVATVHHGLPVDLYAPRFEAGKYLAFIGRISPEKRLDRAIEIARRTSMPLKIAAKVDITDRAYFETEIEPLLHDPLIEYLGEIGDHEKAEFLGNAYALLFPIDWPEPFGLVMIEAMACGTPVVAYRRGSVPEVMEDGVTGYMVETLDEALAAVERLMNFDRISCRAAFERRFTADRMAGDYLEVYRSLQPHYHRSMIHVPQTRHHPH
jgi:glycosyltransferase involved in cell wall biosynthesis